jgi:hypothetical protein
VDTNDPSLPVIGAPYLSPADVHAMYSGPGLTAILSQIQHVPFSIESRTPQGPDEQEVFLSTLDAQVQVNGSPLVPLQMNGPVTTLVLGKTGNVTGTFDTEMLSMSLTGNSAFGPVMVRESPTRPSLGKTSITDIGGGLYHIDSFFDVFTELSVDGGQTWMPDSSGPARVNLFPEPSIALSMSLGMLLLAARKRRTTQA